MTDCTTTTRPRRLTSLHFSSLHFTSLQFTSLPVDKDCACTLSIATGKIWIRQIAWNYLKLYAFLWGTYRGCRYPRWQKNTYLRHPCQHHEMCLCASLFPVYDNNNNLHHYSTRHLNWIAWPRTSLSPFGMGCSWMRVVEASWKFWRSHPYLSGKLNVTCTSSTLVY